MLQWLVTQGLVRIGVPAATAAAVATAVGILLGGCAGQELLVGAEEIVLRRSGSSSRTVVLPTQDTSGILPMERSGSPVPQK